MKIVKNVILSLFLLVVNQAFATTGGDNKNIKDAISMNAYLEQQAKDNDAKNFWELKLTGKNINIVSGALGSKGVVKTQEYVSDTVARFEAYKLIHQKNKEGFYTPNRISLEELQNFKKTNIKDIDKALLKDLQGDHYENFILINGDLQLDRLDIDVFQGKVHGLIVNGNLTVDGGIYNREGDYGPALIVTGNVRADFVFGGGSEIYLNGNNYIHSFVLGHYNHGILSLKNTKAMVAINDDHDMSTGMNSDINYYYEAHKNDEDNALLMHAFGKDSVYFEEGEYFRNDEFMRAIVNNPDESIRLVGKILEANHADKPLLVQVIKDGLSIKEIENPDQEILLAAVKQNGMALEFISSPNEAVQIAAVTETAEAIKFIKNPSEAVQLALVKFSAWGLSYLNNPSDKIIRHALKSDGTAIEFVKDPSEELQLLAFTKTYGLSPIEFIKNPSEKVQLTAVKTRGDALEFVDNPSEAVKLAAVKNDGVALKYIKNPSYEMQLQAVKNTGYVIKYINNPSEELMIHAVKEEAAAILGIENPSEAAQIIVVKDNPYNIGDIKNPTEKVQLLAVTDIPNSIEEIKKPTEKVQLVAIRKEPNVIELIANPSVKAIALAKELANK